MRKTSLREKRKGSTLEDNVLIQITILICGIIFFDSLGMTIFYIFDMGGFIRGILYLFLFSILLAPFISIFNDIKAIDNFQGIIAFYFMSLFSLLVTCFIFILFFPNFSSDMWSWYRSKKIINNKNIQVTTITKNTVDINKKSQTKVFPYSKIVNTQLSSNKKMFVLKKSISQPVISTLYNECLKKNHLVYNREIVSLRQTYLYFYVNEYLAEKNANIGDLEKLIQYKNGILGNDFNKDFISGLKQNLIIK